jgi:uncharacterized protein
MQRIVSAYLDMAETSGHAQNPHDHGRLGKTVGSRSKPELQARFGVTRLALFGSTARDTANSGSDVDVWWPSTARPPPSVISACSSTWRTCFGCPVDLVTEKALRPELRPYIEQERVNV